MPTSFGLSFVAVDILSEGLRVNCRMYPFKIPSFGEYVEDRVRLAKVIHKDLMNRGLADNRDLAPEVVDAIRLMSDYQVAIAVMGDVEDGRKVFARAAATAKRGMIVVQDDQILRFELIRPESLARSVAGLLPPAKAGPGQSVTITKPAPVPRRQNDDLGFRAVAAPRTTSTAQMRGAEEMLRRKRLGSGHFAVSGRDRHGKVTEAPGLSWIDTDAGRYLVQVLEQDGVTTGTYFPADGSRMIHQLNELLKSVG
jgi:hypothetical protein